MITPIGVRHLIDQQDTHWEPSDRYALEFGVYADREGEEPKQFFRDVSKTDFLEALGIDTHEFASIEDPDDRNDLENLRISDVTGSKNPDDWIKTYLDSDKGWDTLKDLADEINASTDDSWDLS